MRKAIIVAILGVFLLPTIAFAEVIAFVSGGDIYTVDSDGSVAPTLLLENAQGAAWSPDGKTLVFNRGTPTGSQLFVSDEEGDNIRQVTVAPGDYFHPTWSPDGTKIAFAASFDELNGAEIHVINLDGTNHTMLTSEGSFNDFPSWSPNGKLIAFVSNRGGSSQTYTMNAVDGGVVTQLTNEGVNSEPKWSPDGKHIAFASNRGVDSVDVYVMDAAGANQRPITNPDNGESSRDPNWSPDGETLVFTTWTDAEGVNLYRVGIDGGTPRQLTHLGLASNPTWQPVSSRPVDVTGKLAIPWAMLKMPQ